MPKSQIVEPQEERKGGKLVCPEIPLNQYVGTPEEELETYRQALITVIAEATRLHSQGLSLEDAQAQADVGDLETWSLSSSQKARALQQVYAELNGELPRESG